MATIEIDGKDYNTDRHGNKAKKPLLCLQFGDAELQRRQAQAA